MADLFTRLAKRTLGLMPVVHARIVSRFAQEEAMASENANIEIPSLFTGDRGLLPGPADPGLSPQMAARETEESSREKSILVAQGDPKKQELISEKSAISERLQGMGSPPNPPLQKGGSNTEGLQGMGSPPNPPLQKGGSNFASPLLRREGLVGEGPERERPENFQGENQAIGPTKESASIREIAESEASKKEESRGAIEEKKVESVESESRERREGGKREIGQIVESGKSASPAGTADVNKEKRSRAIAPQTTASPGRESEVKWPGLDESESGQGEEISSRREEAFLREEETGAMGPTTPGSRESESPLKTSDILKSRVEKVLDSSASASGAISSRGDVQQVAGETVPEGKEDPRAIAGKRASSSNNVLRDLGKKKIPAILGLIARSRQITGILLSRKSLISRGEERSSREIGERAIASRGDVQQVGRETVPEGKEDGRAIALQGESSSNNELRSSREERSSREIGERAIASRGEVQQVGRETVPEGKEDGRAIALEGESSSNNELRSRREERSSREIGERAIASRRERQDVHRVTVEQGREDLSLIAREREKLSESSKTELSSRREELSSRSQGERAIAPESRREVEYVDRVIGEQSREDIRAIAREREKKIELSSTEGSSKSQGERAIAPESRRERQDVHRVTVEQGREDLSESKASSSNTELSSRREELSSRSQGERAILLRSRYAIGPTERDLPEKKALVPSQIAGREEENNRENVGFAAGSKVQLYGSRLAEKRKASVASTPTIEITIGKIEVRGTKPAVKPVQQSRRQPTSPSPRLSLDEYLKQRNGGKK
ncbi:MAG: hypothetical protein EBE86_025110 [Hormoscilla sp. GUM202]|nr:hypothetical protein [Hormoscilla sp. GUM202]